MTAAESEKMMALYRKLNEEKKAAEEEKKKVDKKIEELEKMEGICDGSRGESSYLHNIEILCIVYP